MIASGQATSKEAERYLERILPRLGALLPTAVAKPTVEPQAVAASALLAADFMGQPRWRSKLEQLGRAGVANPEAASELLGVARATLCLLGKLGEVWLPDRDAPALEEAGRSARAELMELLEARLHGSDEAYLWLGAVRLGRGRVDLLLDLRSLADVCTRHGGGLSEVDQARVATASRCADALEAALTAGEDDAVAASRRLLDRAWTLLVPAYEEICRIGRFLGDGGRAGGVFPSLPAISRARRRERLSAIARAVAALDAPRPSQPAPEPSPPPEPSGIAPSPEPPLAAPALTAPQPEAPPAAPVSPPAPPPSLPRPPPPAPNAAPPADAPPTASDPKSTRDSRLRVELEVGIASDSNLYLGFAENLSDGGIFVATYAPMPIGASVELTISLATSAQPLTVRGEVRWIREVREFEGGWPGMGIRFAGLSPADEAALRAFLKQRDPMFFVE